MSTEKRIKTEARANLVSNWVTAVAGLLTVFASWLSGLLIYSAFGVLFGVYNKDGSLNSDKRFIIIGIIVFTCIYIFAVSPFINGFFRLCCGISKGGESEFSDMFYFFSSIKNYFTALHFNSIILIQKIACLLLSLSVFICFEILRYTLNLNEIIDENTLVIISAALLVAGIIAGLVLTIKYLPAEFIFASGEFDDIDDAIFASRTIIIRHARDFRKLVFSFSPYILLCFFVIPVLYVAPYLFTSAATSSKWLISLYKEGKMV